MKLICFFIFSLSFLYASPIVITDNYIGGITSHKQDVGKDVIGSKQYDITKATVDIFESDIVIQIYADYFKHSIADEIGDLFLSVDGYKPGDDNDDYLSGEEWEYVLRVEKGSETYGDLTLYKISDKERDIIITNEIAHDKRYRMNQELFVDTKHAQLIDKVGTWSLETNYVQFSFDISQINFETLGFHWTMENGRDVIEASFSKQVAVPEPPTVLLFLTGICLMIVVGYSRKVNLRS